MWGPARRDDDDFAREIDAHIQTETDRLIGEGMDAAEARREAHRAFGNPTSTRERFYESHRVGRLDGVRRDVRYALRTMRRSPAFTATVVLTLALGIGANTAVFSLIRPLLLAPLPFDDPGSLVWLADTGDGGLSGSTYQVDVYNAIREQSSSLADATAYFAFFGFGTHTLTGRGDPERVSILPVAPRFFELLGVRLAMGQLFTEEEWRPNGPAAVIVSHNYWQRRFAEDPTVVGSTLTIDGQPTRIAGVLPATFDFSSVFMPGTTVDMFAPAILPTMRTWGNTLAVIGRLKPHVTIDQARSEWKALVPALEAAHPEWGPFGVRAASLEDHVSGSVRRSLAVLWGAVGMVLLIVCANVSNLLLARSTTRMKEFAIRMALGAARRRVVQQLVIEGVLLSSCGGLLSVPLAYALTALLKRQVGLAIPLLYRSQVNAWALVVTAAIAMATGLVVSVLPGLRLSGANPNEALNESARGSTDGRRHDWTRSALVVAEIALATTLLVAAGLLGRSLLRVLDSDFGFHPASATALTIDLRGTHPPAESLTLLAEAARRTSLLPQVEAAGLTDALPLDNNRAWSVSVPGVTYDPAQQPTAFAYVVGVGYLKAMGIPLVAGRDFSPLDSPMSPSVVIVSESLARTLYPGHDAVGRTASTAKGRVQTIIGVVRDVRQTRLEDTPSSQIYLPYAQGGGVGARLVVRSTAPPQALIGTIRATLTDLDGGLLVTDVRPLDDLVDRAVSPRRFLVALLGGFSAFALVFASLGIYGVVSFNVGQRTREIGIRMALGATGADVRHMVLRGTLRLALIGIVLGTGASLLANRIIAGLLFNTSPTDGLTFVSTALILVAIACIAGYIPALRASLVEPTRALQQ